MICISRYDEADNGVTLRFKGNGGFACVTSYRRPGSALYLGEVEVWRLGQRIRRFSSTLTWCLYNEGDESPYLGEMLDKHCPLT